jgi:hypothetical protein
MGKAEEYIMSIEPAPLVKNKADMAKPQPLAQWFHDREQVEWGTVGSRFCCGKTRLPLDEADKEAERGLLREWPSAK